MVKSQWLAGINYHITKEGFQLALNTETVKVKTGEVKLDAYNRLEWIAFQELNKGG